MFNVKFKVEPCRHLNSQWRRMTYSATMTTVIAGNKLSMSERLSLNELKL
jgi:hypothetical protein